MSEQASPAQERFRVRMTGVLGDQEEFAHMIGMHGSIDKCTEGGSGTLVFWPDYGGEWLQMPVRKRVDSETEVRIETKLGNTFIFKKL